MYALTTLFNFDSLPVFADIWQKLKKNCGLVTIDEFSFVHLSWQGAQGYQLESVHDVLGEIACSTKAIPIKTAGIGVFSGHEPVLFLNVVKSHRLMELHEMLWDRIIPFSQEYNAYYAPDEWVPHITLTHGPFLPADLACAISELMFEPLSLELNIDNLALIFMQDGSVGIDSRYSLAA